MKVELHNLNRAFEVGRNSWSERTLSYARILARLWTKDRPFGRWMEELEDYERAHANEDPADDPLMQAATSGVRPAAPAAPATSATSATSVDSTQESEKASPVGVESARFGTLRIGESED